MKQLLGIVLAILALPSCATVHAADGLIALDSPYGVAETADRVEALAADRGLKVFARIDHAAGAASIGATLHPTVLVIFGNPKGGTPLMQCAQSVAIDLPLKALIWEDENGDVRIGYNDLAYLATRHAAGDCPAFDRVSGAIEALLAAVVAP